MIKDKFILGIIGLLLGVIASCVAVASYFDNRPRIIILIAALTGFLFLMLGYNVILESLGLSEKEEKN